MPHFTLKQLAALLFVLAASPLALALASQYGFGLHPCELCVWQRVPLVVLMCIAPFALKYPRAALLASALVWAGEAGLAFYHVGVEQHWWQSATGCTAGGGAAQSLEQLRAQIMGAPLVACDVPELVVLGLSMAGWNGLYSLMCVCLLGSLTARRMRRAQG